MNIGVNARLLTDKPLEGMGRYTLETVYAMAKAHPESKFFLFFDQKIHDKYLLLPNMTGVLVWCPTKHPILILIWMELLLPFFLKKYKIDVFYSADNFTSLLTNTPSVLICHDLAFKHYPRGLSGTYLYFYQKFMPRYLKKAKCIGTVSNYVKNDIISFINFSKTIFLAPNAMPVMKFDSFETINPISISEPYFIYVGSIHPRKNVKRMIEGFLKFNQRVDQNYYLVLLGRNAWGEDLDQYLKNEKIIHLIDVGDQDKMAYISKSVGLLYVSIHEGFGIPILEGFASGVPVITSNVSSMPEVAGDGAILVNPYSIEEISDALYTITFDQEKRKDLIKKAELKLSEYSWERSATEIYKHISSLINLT